ncbi:putative acetyl-CoA synthetase-like protein [Rhizoctonia solani 123E]|uniref:Putative acetyl-CoA synthetase-like protein n=1 Tax=Rhizoctonia solani 123E TaxID=1423351 RepID=A0A074RMG0_9AGAM|nr:putative acetyl-CoA synthetase-like protein [Rhizoctonia solani 123E]
MTTTPLGFVFPPTDGSVPPALAIDFHLKNNPKHLFSVLHNVNDSSHIDITYERLAHAVYRTAHILNPNRKFPQGTNIGFLVSTHTIQYIIMILGAMRAGLVVCLTGQFQRCVLINGLFQPFPISPRTHIPGITHLLASTQTSLLVTGGGQSISDITHQLAHDLTQIDFSVQFLPVPPLETILPELGELEAPLEHGSFPCLKSMTNDTTVSILHSSGSTGMPRPVKYHLEGVFKNFINQPFGWMYARDGIRFGSMALPTFHAMGMFIQIFMPLYAGYTQVLFAPGRIPVVPTPNLTLEAAVSTKCTFIMCVPAFLETWSRDKDAIAHLRQMRGIMFGGGPLADPIASKLAEQGVRTHCCYGATEVGHVHEIWDLDDSSDRGYIKFSSQVDARFIPQNDADHTFELVFVVSDDHRPFVLNSEFDGMPAYKTKDLVVRHPFKPDLWKIFGRLDDQIILLNGEKTNPGPMETEIVRCPIVRYAIMFGRERTQTGVLVELEESAHDLYRTMDKHIQAIEQIWPFIERANRTSPTHSRLEKKAVIIVDPARPLPRTPKGTISRSAAFKLYARDIKGMYLDLEKCSGASTKISPRGLWTSLDSIEAWVGKSVKHLLGREVDVTGDLFQQGMDSLTATMLLRILRNVLEPAAKINQQTIFDKPTIRQLAQLLAYLSKSGDVTVDPITDALDSMRAMVQKYDSNWPCLVNPGLEQVDKERVVLTGTTGALGSHLLAQLLESDKVEKVWAMNRKSTKDNQERAIASFEDKLLDVALLKSEKLVFVDVDLEDPKLGLCDEVYDEIRVDVTIVIHNAWQVNFNLSLQSFEPSIHGVRNLLDLAFRSTAPTGSPRFLFASSISVAGFSGCGKHLSEVPVVIEDAATSIGYGQSKLVAEKIIESANRAGLQTCIIRLGQLTGDLKSGSWTPTDWVPSLIGSSISVGCLPSAVGSVSWLPLDIAARSIIDTCVARNADLPLVVHASHPRPVPWVDMIGAFSTTIGARTGSKIPIVRFSEWNRRVIEAASSYKGSESDRYRRFPSTKIQGAVDGMVRADNELRSHRNTGNAESGGTARLDTTMAEALSKTLSCTLELGIAHVEKWVGYWESRGLFKLA